MRELMKALSGLAFFVAVVFAPAWFVGCGEDAVPTNPTGVSAPADLPRECQVGAVEGHYEFQNGTPTKVWGLGSNPNAVVELFNRDGERMAKVCGIKIPINWEEETLGSARCRMYSDGSSVALTNCTTSGDVSPQVCVPTGSGLTDKVCAPPFWGKVVG